MVLGLIWNLKDDCLSCNINCQKNEGKAITKRSLLSIANHIFDPIGFTAPVTLKPKLILQEIWKLKLEWDENLPKGILNQVKKWLEQLPILASIKIPGCLNLSSNGIKRLTLHVFCDASKKAYAACVFLRVEYEENVFVKLIQAKARVAPLKDISIPRLELLACVLGTRLAASVKNDLNLPDVRIYYLTDSMTALAWIQRTRDWGVFVSNRVKEIRNLSHVSSWEHVPSEKNFADILSRGCNAEQLVYLRWWEGPSWLSETPVQCPRSKQVPDEEAVNLELRKSVLVNTAKRIEEFNWHSQYFSSYLKVVRMIAWIFRFFKNAKRIDVCNTSEITFSEFDHAEKTVIKLIQMEKFEGVTDEKLRPLKPFLDEFGILRARTKLSFREDTHNFKFPIILPNEHPVVHLMIVRKHEELMHAGQLREQTQHHRKLRPLTVGVVVVENSLKNRTLWSLARVIQLIPGKDGHVRVARVKTETGELVRPVQRLYNLELQESETNLPKDLTDSVIHTRRGRKVISPKRLTYA
ncbi:integrase catalytic domain-containing protein [Trichonephila clavipes]|nr:integrase catalytic domain-containing protein [Trichonephila clavipes]